jgi:hypothetical protein
MLPSGSNSNVAASPISIPAVPAASTSECYSVGNKDENNIQSNCEASPLRPLVLHLDPLTCSQHDTKKVAGALGSWLRSELEREVDAEICPAAALSAVDCVRVRSHVP